MSGARLLCAQIHNISEVWQPRRFNVPHALQWPVTDADTMWSLVIGSQCKFEFSVPPVQQKGTARWKFLAVPNIPVERTSSRDATDCLYPGSPGSSTGVCWKSRRHSRQTWGSQTLTCCHPTLQIWSQNRSGAVLSLAHSHAHWNQSD